MEDEIILKHEENEKTFTFKQMELEVNITEKAYEACEIGRKRKHF